MIFFQNCNAVFRITVSTILAAKAAEKAPQGPGIFDGREDGGQKCYGVTCAKAKVNQQRSALF